MTSLNTTIDHVELKNPNTIRPLLQRTISRHTSSLHSFRSTADPEGARTTTWQDRKKLGGTWWVELKVGSICSRLISVLDSFAASMESSIDQDQQWLLNCLAATLDPNHEVRSFSEASLHQASLQPGS